MVESFDFALGIIVGVLITFIGNYLTEKWKESVEKKNVARALITELTVIKESFLKYQSHKIRITILSTSMPKLILFKGNTIDSILKVYHDINWSLEVSSLIQADLEHLTQEIDKTIKIIEKEIDC